MAGVDLVSVKEILGHRDIETTMRYAHLAPGHLRQAVNRGSLTGTVTKTVTKEEEKPEEMMQPVDYMVRPEGLEPPTLGSEVRCSIQLSYGRARRLKPVTEGKSRKAHGHRRISAAAVSDSMARLARNQPENALGHLCRGEAVGRDHMGGGRLIFGRPLA